ncbi:androgen-dependent TFPI-regulating protein-like [Galleria mellonella]|uniref:Androgen-dependent TFPI-regulating protein-like n=1 Tax=Galleria mellonella TaxID=7137 RepID=A0A6J1WL69_GALME|nr:androgen-dependent TFPI-regulating protein-like [Galleria mellonella]XP_052754328.1 androgen-dependent TFPI-regulating protein-like [Galleria mellonella]XP_052754329.1 androgen-dependent TFPI-regulating protein-like [Galleria mellonella]
MSGYIYFRILGYVVTITLQVGNWIVMTQPISQDVMADSKVRGFVDMRSRFLTHWTVFVQIFYALTGLSCDVLTLLNSKRNYEPPRFLKGFRDTFFAAIVWPSTLLVFTFFWTLYVLDRKLIYPPFLDKILAPASNHIMHTAIVPSALWELYFQPRSVPKSHKKNLIHMILYYALYLSVFIYTYVEKGKWVYPIFQKIYGTIYFYVVLVFVSVLCLLYYYLQWPLTSKAWASLEKQKTKRKIR